MSYYKTNTKIIQTKHSYLFSAKPMAPEIHHIRSARQGKAVSFVLECVSKGGNPVPLVRWFNPNMTSSQLNASVSVVLENDDTYTVTSRLSVVTSEKDVFMCQSSLRYPPHIVQSTEYHFKIGT